MKEKKDKTIVILIVAVVHIIVVATALFIIFKRKESNKPLNNNYPEYKEKVSELLKEDSTLKKLFYSKIDASENPITVDNATYYLIEEKYGYTTIKQIYEKISDLDRLVPKGESHKFGRTYHFNAIAVNKKGLKNIFKMI